MSTSGPDYREAREYYRDRAQAEKQERMGSNVVTGIPAADMGNPIAQADTGIPASEQPVAWRHSATFMIYDVLSEVPIAAHEAKVRG